MSDDSAEYSKKGISRRGFITAGAAAIAGALVHGGPIPPGVPTESSAGKGVDTKDKISDERLSALAAIEYIGRGPEWYREAVVQPLSDKGEGTLNAELRFPGFRPDLPMVARIESPEALGPPSHVDAIPKMPVGSEARAFDNKTGIIVSRLQDTPEGEVRVTISVPPYMNQLKGKINQPYLGENDQIPVVLGNPGIYVFPPGFYQAIAMTAMDQVPNALEARLIECAIDFRTPDASVRETPKG